MDPLELADQALAGDALKPKARAQLLLQLSQIWSLFDLDRARPYWEKLQPLADRLEDASLETYRWLQGVFEPKAIEPKGLTAELLQVIQAEAEEGGTDPEAAKAKLREAEARLRRRWWWPFGRKAAWSILVEKWSELDRVATIAY